MQAMGHSDRATDDPRGFPHGTEEEFWTFLLHYAVKAPSGHNTQPWRFRISDGRLNLYADRSRSLPVVDPEDRELVMSCGAALAHLTVALRHYGHSGDVSPFPDPSDRDLLASVGIGQPRSPGPADHELLEAIEDRHTHRAPFDHRPVPRHVLAQLRRDALHAGTTLNVCTEDESKRPIATLVREGDRAQFADARFRRELAAWMRPNRTRRPDGIPGYAFGVSDLASLLGPTMISTFNIGSAQARKDERLALTAPALVVLSTSGDDASDWLRAGQAAGVFLLRAAANGLAASFLNQPIEMPELRVRLGDLVGSGSPQLLLRIGYASTSAGRPTPRRTVGEVLTEA
jgi:hypothetical protein